MVLLLKLKEKRKWEMFVQVLGQRTWKQQSGKRWLWMAGFWNSGLLTPNCTYTVVVCFFSPSVKNMKDNRLFLSPSSEENDVAFRLLVIIFPAFTIFCAVFFLFLFFFLTYGKSFATNNSRAVWTFCCRLAEYNKPQGFQRNACLVCIDSITSG